MYTLRNICVQYKSSELWGRWTKKKSSPKTQQPEMRFIELHGQDKIFVF